MDMHTLTWTAITVLVAVIGYILRTKHADHAAIWEAVNNLTTLVNNHRVEVAREYVSIARFEKFENSVLHALHEVNANLLALAKQRE
jgi:hypothetical protein